MRGSTRLFLFRHGRVADDWHGRVYGDLDVPLSPQGERESERAARSLAGESLDAVVSSGLARAEFLARLLRAGRGLERRDDPRLREIGRGGWRGRTAAEIDADEAGAFGRWTADPVRLRPPEGESLADVAARVEPALAELVRAFPGGRVAVVAHSWVVRVAACRALDLPLASAPRLAVPTGGLVVVDAPLDPAERPTLAGFVLEAPPEAGTTWFRGAHRGH